MTPDVLRLCNAVNAELQIERFNIRMTHVARCFQYDHFLGIDVKSLKKDRLYYNNYFDMLMSMTLEQLEKHEIKMFKITKDYGESISRDYEG